MNIITEKCLAHLLGLIATVSLRLSTLTWDIQASTSDNDITERSKYTRLNKNRKECMGDIRNIKKKYKFEVKSECQ